MNLPKFKYFKTKAAFDKATIEVNDICFIEEEPMMYIRNHVFYCIYGSDELKQELDTYCKVNKPLLEDTVITQDDFIDNLSYEDFLKRLLNFIINSNLNLNNSITSVDTKLNNSTVNGYKITSNPSLTKSDVGLSNVDNTSDLNKPISTATQTAITEEANRAKAAEEANAKAINKINTESIVNLLNQINTLVNGNASSAIESFNEIISFLDSIEDTETLSGIIAGLETKLSEENTRATNRENSIETALNNEIERAKEAENTNSLNISTNSLEITNVSNSLAAEVTRAQTSEAANAKDIATNKANIETNAAAIAKNAENITSNAEEINKVSNSLTAEIERAKEAEKTVSDDLAAEVTRAKTAEGENSNNISKIKNTLLSHINDTNTFTKDASKVTFNYECFEGSQYGATGISHTADIPAATTSTAGVMTATDKSNLDSVTSNISNKVDKVSGKSLVDDTQITKLTALKTLTELNTSIADAKKAGTDALETIDKHLENDTNGLNHIPSDGHERQILSWSSEGKAKWDNLSNIFTGLEELLAYGVQWDTTVADPHLTRIGNMSLHKSLPIQSLLKGCIAQLDKVIYWLDESDWRFKKETSTISVDLSENQTEVVVTSVAGLGKNQYLRNGENIAKITAIDSDTLTLTLEWLGIEDTTTLSSITSLEVGSRLDGYDGTVRVYCPNFYIKSQIIDNTRKVWLSTVKIDNTWTYQPEILVDAYRSTVLNTVPSDMGYLSTLSVNSAISVVNTETYCRGGNNRSTYDTYLTSDIFRSDLGKPRTNMSRATMRTYSRNAGSQMLSYELYKNIFYWLWVVEYANFNSQETYNSELTEDGYHLGGMGSGVTTWNSSPWNDYNGYYPITPCGYLNELGNGTGLKEMITGTGMTFQVPRWRGFDNPFGDIWTNLDGCIHYNYIFYVINDSDNYTDSITDITTKADRAVEECHSSGHCYKEFNIGDSADIVPDGSGSGSATTYKCDYHWTASGGPHILVVGGCAYNGGHAGLGSFDSDYSVSYAHTIVGFRSVASFVSFSGNN